MGRQMGKEANKTSASIATEAVCCNWVCSGAKNGNGAGCFIRNRWGPGLVEPPGESWPNVVHDVMTSYDTVRVYLFVTVDLCMWMSCVKSTTVPHDPLRTCTLVLINDFASLLMVGRSGGRLDPQQLASKNKFQKMQPTINSESCFPSTSLRRRDADDALAARTFARSHKSSTNLMVSAPGHADFRPMHDLQVGKRELRTNSKF